MKYALVDTDILSEFLRGTEIWVSAAKQAAEIYANLRKKGQSIGHTDCLIAGIALTNNLQLVTNNIDHFKRIKGLEIVNWLKWRIACCLHRIAASGAHGKTISFWSIIEQQFRPAQTELLGAKECLLSDSSNNELLIINLDPHNTVGIGADGILFPCLLQAVKRKRQAERNSH